MSVRELFNEQLRNAEAIPDKAFEQRLMRKLARKEFIRFIPSKFNIFYLGGIVAAGIIAGLLITSSPEKNNVIPSESITPDTSVINDLQTTSSITSTNEIISSVKRKSTDLEEVASRSVNSPGELVENIDNKISIITDNESVTALINNKQIEVAEPERKSISEQQNYLAEQPLARFEMSSSAGCSPVKIKFINTSMNYDSCLWTFGDGGSSNEINPEWIFDEEGIYRISLSVFNKAGLISVFSNSLEVYPKPHARFEISSDNINIPDDEVHFMNYSSNAVSYKWEFGDGKFSEDFEPVYRYNNNGNFNVRLIVKSVYGCTDSLVVVNAFSGSAFYISFPNAFIPNSGGPAGGNYSLKSDESAQIFHPVSSGVADYQLRIFSRQGILIFESNDIYDGWDGYYKGQLNEPGVYIWKVRGKFNNGEPFVKMGDVMLLKN
jgi:PKD repeat protein